MLSITFAFCSSSDTSRESSRPSGPVGAIVKPNAAYVPAICMDTDEGLSEALKWAGRKDIGEIFRVMGRLGGQFVNEADQLKILDTGFLKTKVRVLRTDRECYVVSEVVR
jgi:hypothetical protein